MTKVKSVSVVERPYTLVFHSSGNAYPLTSEDAQRLIDEYPLIYATKNRVSLRGDGVGNNSTIIPATKGGTAFQITK